MADTFIWIFKFCEIMIVLTCCISQSDAQCSQDIKGVYRFGSECGFICHCLKNEQCDVSTGECPSGCDFEWVGPGCQHKNIALNGYERHLDNMQPRRYADLANDRDLSTCSHTGDENTTRIVNPFWRVWRPFNFTLRQMEILTLDSKKKYFDGFKIIVEYVPNANKEDNNYNPALSQICYTHGNTSLESVSLAVFCEHDYSGNQVKIQLGRRNTQLVLCDVRIYGECAENVCTYDCNKLCFCKNITTNDKVSGICSNGCRGRWSGKNGACDRECAIDKWGATCDIKCGRCRHDVPCDAVTGKCPSGCEDGYKDTQQCNIVCDDGRYGQDCNSFCSGHCNKNTPCRKQDGHCPGGCAPGFTGEKCSERCSLGYYGKNCIHKCSEFCNGSLSFCSHEDGICLYGCLSGYKGQLCDQVCETGKWGVNCSSLCGMCLTGTCNHTDGICMDGSGCKAGYIFHPRCDQECYDGTYGHKCLSHCSENCNNNVPCRKTDGLCPDGCARGYTGRECTEICPVGYHGHDCKEKCSANCAGGQVDCDKSYGTCLAGCIPGWTGRTCQEETSTETTAVIAGVGAAIIVVIILGVLAILWYLRRIWKSNVDKQENREYRGMAMSKISSEASGVKQTDKSCDTYDTLQGGNADEHQYEIADQTHRF